MAFISSSISDNTVSSKLCPKPWRWVLGILELISTTRLYNLYTELMTGNSPDIDLSLANLWQAWFDFRHGKRSSPAVAEFEYYLERNLFELHQALNDRSYRHGAYQRFVVHDNKRREIAVAGVGDRIVHRLLYNYLVPLFDKTFIYDAWSCRQGKGHHAAINRARTFMRRYRDGWYWRTDITKFFNSVNQSVMKELLRRRVQDKDTLWLIDEVINSYTV